MNRNYSNVADYFSEGICEILFELGQTKIYLNISEIAQKSFPNFKLFAKSQNVCQIPILFTILTYFKHDFSTYFEHVLNS